MTTTVSFTVPRCRAAAGSWLRDQPHDTVANVLDATELLYGTVATASSLQTAVTTDLVRNHAAEVQRLRVEHAEELQKAISELRPAVEEQCAKTAKVELENVKVRHAAEMERVQERQARAYQDLQSDRDAYQADADKMRGSLAMREANVREVREEAAERVRVEYEARLAQQKELHDKSESYQKELMQEVQAHASSALKDVREELARKDREMREMQSTAIARVETLFGSLVGNSAKRGDLGEGFVKLVHSELQLGTLSRTARLKCTGFADFAWEMIPPSGPIINGIVEVKFSLQGNAVRDVHKFCEDVREAAQTGRANMAVYLSLVDRVDGRPKISMEVMHGIPVLWVGRNVDDDLSARSLVELAFTTCAHVWSQVALRDADETDAVLKRVHDMVSMQIGELEKMDAHLRVIEKACESIRAGAVGLRAMRDRVLGAAHQFRVQHDGTIAPDDASFRHEVSEAVRAFYTKRKRYARTASDLGLVVPAHHASDADGIVASVVKQLKSEKYSEAANKRHLKEEKTPEEEEA